MNWRKVYQMWVEDPNLDMETKAELAAIENDKETIEDSFYTNLTFGTGGMRGEMGPGPNRMNRYTVRKASEGLARYIENSGEEAKIRGVVIAYDSRHRSAIFAKETALTLGRHGIRTYLFDDLRPTPELSFAVRNLKAFAGVVITASHNPPQYNGYKVYGEDGGQLPPAEADRVTEKVNDIDNELDIPAGNEEELRRTGLLQMIGDKVDHAYIEKMKTISEHPEVLQQMAGELKVVYTPLHGTGGRLVRRGFTSFGLQQIHLVSEQAEPDPDFSTVTSPNPEDPTAFSLAIQVGKQVDADILLATDPDADRLGLAVKNQDGDYTILTGNQTGALLLHYLLSQKQKAGTLPRNGTVFKTIVTSEFGRAIASHYGMGTEDTLTGFKFIGERIKDYDQSGDHSFLFGYEESSGYLIGDFVRDKDAVQACLFAAEVAAYYKSNGMSLYEVLSGLYEQYGWYRESLESVTLRGQQGITKIGQVMEAFRQHPPVEVTGRKVTVLEDYDKQSRMEANGYQEPLALPRANVLKFKLEGDAWFCLRPSGTEPKLKLYFAVRENSADESNTALDVLQSAVMEKVQNQLNT